MPPFPTPRVSGECCTQLRTSQNRDLSEKCGEGSKVVAARQRWQLGYDGDRGDSETMLTVSHHWRVWLYVGTFFLHPAQFSHLFTRKCAIAEPNKKEIKKRSKKRVKKKRARKQKVKQATSKQASKKASKKQSNCVGESWGSGCNFSVLFIFLGLMWWWVTKLKPEFFQSLFRFHFLVFMGFWFRSLVWSVPRVPLPSPSHTLSHRCHHDPISCAEISRLCQLLVSCFACAGVCASCPCCVVVGGQHNGKGS